MSAPGDDIVQMANQIATFFAPYPRDEAERSIAQHIRDFWDPRMRRALAAHLAAGGAGLDDLAEAGARRACPDGA